MKKIIPIRRIHTDNSNWFFAERYISYEDEWQTLDEIVTGKVYEVLDDSIQFLKETDPHNYFYFRVNENDHLVIATSNTCNCTKQRHYHYKEDDTDITFNVINNKKT